jgi:hypothetical protein
MKKLLVGTLVLAGTTLGGCVAYEVPTTTTYGYGYGTYGYATPSYSTAPVYRDRDRDRDGVPNRWDRRPDNPYRY